MPLPASQCVCPATGESAAGPEGPPWDLGSESPAAQAGSGAAPSQSNHLGAALPSASSATERCARRSRGPAEGCVGRHAGASPGGGGCRLLPHRPQPPVESRAWGGRHVLTQHPHRARVLRSGPSCPLAVWTMSAGPAASGTPAPSVLKCSPTGPWRGPGATAPAGKGQGHPQKPQGQPPLLGPHPCTRTQPGDLAAGPGGSGCRSLEPLCSCCPEGLLGNLQRPPQGLFSNALVLLKRDTQSRDGAGITGAVTPVNQGVTAPSS